MITTIVYFDLSPSFTPDKARLAFSESAQKFLHLQGLIRKYFLLSEHGKSAARVYLWETRKQAEAFNSKAWKDFIRDKYGFPPSVVYYECPVVVDNHAEEIIRV